MKFKAEIDLVVTLKASIKSCYRSSHLKIFDEVSVGYGVADIVVSNLKSPTFKQKRSRSTLDRLDINIYSLIQKSKRTSTEEIVNITRCSKSATDKSILKLLKSGYILREADCFVTNKTYELPFRYNFAVEAKLKDWRKALKQAYRYKWFAEYSYVVLDTHHSKPAVKNLNCFIKYNVGLASISTDGTLMRHFKPKRDEPFDPKMQILLSEKMRSQALAK